MEITQLKNIIWKYVLKPFYRQRYTKEHVICTITSRLMHSCKMPEAFVIYTLRELRCVSLFCVVVLTSVITSHRLALKGKLYEILTSF